MRFRTISEASCVDSHLKTSGLVVECAQSRHCAGFLNLPSLLMSLTTAGREEVVIWSTEGRGNSKQPYVGTTFSLRVRLDKMVGHDLQPYIYGINNGNTEPRLKRLKVKQMPLVIASAFLSI